MKKIKAIFYIICVVFGLMTASCVDDDSFTTSASDVLSFSVDTLSLDTTFSNVPTPTKTMWVYNRANKGIRCQSCLLSTLKAADKHAVLVLVVACPIKKKKLTDTYKNRETGDNKSG